MGPLDAYYVHYVLTGQEVNYFSQAFIQNKKLNQDNIALKIISDKLKAKLKAEGSNQTVEEYMQLVNSMLQSDKMKQAIANMDQQLQIQNYYARSAATTGQALTDEAVKIQKDLDILESAVAYIIAAFEGNMEKVNKLRINQNLKVKAKKLFEGSNQSFTISDTELQNIEKTFLGQYSSLIAKLETMESKPISGLLKDEKFLAYANSLVSRINRLIGIASEYVVKNQVNLMEMQITDGFNKTYNVTATRAGGDKGEAFMVGTTDIKLKFTPTGEASGSVNLPSLGISLKRTGKKETKSEKMIHLKSAKVGSMLNAIQGNIMTQHKINSFYNLYANYNRPFTKQKPKAPEDRSETISQNTLQSMYSMLKMAFVGASMVGSMSKEDFSTILVVNDQMYSIVDILKDLTVNDISNNTSKAIQIKDKKFLELQQPRVAKMHIEKSAAIRNYSLEKKFERSNAICDYINRLSFQASIKLNYLKYKSS